LHRSAFRDSRRIGVWVAEVHPVASAIRKLLRAWLPGLWSPGSSGEV